MLGGSGAHFKRSWNQGYFQRCNLKKKKKYQQLEQLKLDFDAGLKKNFYDSQKTHIKDGIRKVDSAIIGADSSMRLQTRMQKAIRSSVDRNRSVEDTFQWV